MDEGDLEHCNQRGGGRWKKAGGEELVGNVTDVLFWQDLFPPLWPGWGDLLGGAGGCLKQSPWKSGES